MIFITRKFIEDSNLGSFYVFKKSKGSNFKYNLEFKKYEVNLDCLASEISKNKDFAEGWSLLGRKKDVSDEEWQLWVAFLSKLMPWIFLHAFVSELTRFVFVEALPICYLMTTLTVLILNFPLVVPAFLILQLSLFFLAMITSSITVIWSLGLFFLLFVNNNIKHFQQNFNMDDTQINLLHVANGWFFIRCLDFVLSEVGANSSLPQQFLNYLAYVFYLPCFFLGPFIPYDHFNFQVISPGFDVKKRSVSLIKSSFLYLFYFSMYEFASHYLYCHAMHYNAKSYLPAGLWTVSGIGLCLANFFYLKYLIIYGLSTTIAKAENYRIPSPPKCIYHIHLYSKMWRHFDRGFYLFMFRRIYYPICSQKGAAFNRRMLASFLCFLFVYIWHGATISVLYWSLLNYFGLLCESIFKYFWNASSLVKNFVVNQFSTRNVRRFEALAASPLWLLAVISNLIFFGGHEFGLLLFEQIIKGSFLFHFVLILIAYSMCQVSIETSDFETKAK